MMLDSNPGIHAFMTNQMKTELRACGFSEPQLEQLTPQEGDEILTAANTVVPDSNEVGKCIEIIAAHARAATKHLKEPGLLQVSRIHPLDETVVPYRYALNNPKLVEQKRARCGAVSRAKSAERPRIPSLCSRWWSIPMPTRTRPGRRRCR